MPITNIYSNNNQYNPVIVTVNPSPAAIPEDLVWTSGPTGTTTAGVAGTIFTSMYTDNTVPAYWYHGGNPLTPVEDLSFFGLNVFNATYTTNKVVSGKVTKGINELRLGNTKSISSINTSSITTFTTSSAHGLQVGDMVFIDGLTTVAQANGYWYVETIPLTTTFTLVGYTGGGSSTAEGTAQLAKYYWDEVYTTPLGLYNAVSDATALGSYDFKFTADNSNELTILVTDPNILPQVGDSIVLQRYFTTHPTPFINASTTDGINNVVNFPKAETYTFKIQAVTFTQFPMVNAVGVPYTEYVLTLDKSFAPILTTATAYMVVLLNRTGIGVNKELYTDTWNLNEVHREQLLGDPYDYSGVLQPRGRKNYLYYEGAKYLGLRALLDGLVNTEKSPLLILSLDNAIKDRICYDTNEVEIHLPNLMLQDEVVPTIMVNNNAVGSPITYSTEIGGANRYAPLYLKNAKNTTKQYGWVFYDLRIIVFDDPEFVTALGYATKRNYTLPPIELPNSGNRLENSGPSTPLTIVSVTAAITAVVTTSVNHNFQSGDSIIIKDVQGTTTANTPVNGVYYVNVLTPTTFELYQDPSLAPIYAVSTFGQLPIGGTGVCYSTKLPFEYFITYRIKDVHYNTLPYAKVTPFNFATNGVIDNYTGGVLFKTEAFTHLVDSVNLNGFEADELEIIIGKYTPSVSNFYVSDDIQDVAVLQSNTLGLKTLGVQNLAHQLSIDIADYLNAVMLAPYNLLVDEPIFNVLASLPSTMYISENSWLLGNVVHREEVDQYRMTLTFTIPPEKWNGSTNPTYEAGNEFMTNKFITEMAFYIDDNTATTNKPYIYGKVSPALQKSNASTLNVEISIDF